MKRDISGKKINGSGLLVLSDVTLFVHFWNFIIVGLRTSFRMNCYSEIDV